MDFSTKKEGDHTSVVLIGDLDEDFDSKNFEQLLRQGASQGRPVRILLRDVESGNSTGIGLFLQCIKTCEVPVRYTEVPHWILIQMNFLRDFLLKNALVESVLVDCTEVGSKESQTLVVAIGKELPVCKEYTSDIQFRRDGKTYHTGLNADDLAFITFNYERFRVLEQ